MNILTTFTFEMVKRDQLQICILAVVFWFPQWSYKYLYRFYLYPSSDTFLSPEWGKNCIDFPVS
jgi:hypothetical protein